MDAETSQFRAITQHQDAEDGSKIPLLGWGNVPLLILALTDAMEDLP